VNAGDADHWIGTEENTARPVATAIAEALGHAREVPANEFRLHTGQVPLPFDLQLFQQWLDEYRGDPSKCSSGPWVDARFAEDWYRGSRQRDLTQTHLPVSLSAWQLGDVGLLFHPAELYSCYGLEIRRDSPFPDTLVLGYADDIIGYLPDPQAYQDGEYSAITVPKILDLPPFQPTAARELTAAAVSALHKLVA
jgi:hypothetical protein